MTALKKFTFDAFDAPPPPTVDLPTFLAEDLEAARQAAFIEGEEAGRQAALTLIEQAAADSAAEIARAVAALFSSEAARTERAKVDAATLAHAIAQKLAPRLLAAAPLAEIEGVVAHCLATCFTEPRLVVRVAPALIEPLEALTGDLAAAHGFAGKLILLGDSAMSGSDCKVEWAHGGLERNEHKLHQEIDQALDRFLRIREGGADLMSTSATVEHANGH